MKATESKLLQILGTVSQFIIPSYQRINLWTLQECQQLWADTLCISKDHSGVAAIQWPELPLHRLKEPLGSGQARSPDHPGCGFAPGPAACTSPTLHPGRHPQGCRARPHSAAAGRTPWCGRIAAQADRAAVRLPDPAALWWPCSHDGAAWEASDRRELDDNGGGA
jgi:hypothetical protein